MSDFLLSVGYDRWILGVLLALPVVGAAAVLVAPARAARGLALALTLAEFVLSLGLWWAYVPGGPAMQFLADAPWINDWGIAYRVGLDGISLVMVLLSTGLMPLAVLGSWESITERPRAYYAFLLTLLTGMLGVFVALDLFLFYVFWEVMLVPMYFIIGIWGGKDRLRAAIKFFIYTMAGSLLMLVAILVMVWRVAAETGTTSFAYDHLLEHAATMGGAAPWLFAAFAIAFAIKVPVVPFHTWLPDAHTEAPAAGSVLLASVLLKMGTYGFLRFAVPFFPEVALGPTVTAIAVTLAVAGILYGALVALVQPDVKRLVAYSSVSHLGFVMLGIWALTLQGVQGALIVMIAHGFSTGALFFLIGMLYDRRHTRLLADFGGIARVMPVFATLFVFTSLASVGLPGLSGFAGEFLVLLGSFPRHGVATVIATTVVIFAAAYLLVAVQRLFYGPLDKEANRGLTDLSRREVAVLLPLVAGMVWLGLYPKPVLDRMEPSAKAFLEQVTSRMPRPGAEPDRPAVHPMAPPARGGEAAR